LDALASFNPRSSSSSSGGGSGNSGGGVSDGSGGDDEDELAYGEALRRYEVLAQLGEPQAQLNTAFLLHQLASSSSTTTTSSFSSFLPFFSSSFEGFFGSLNSFFSSGAGGNEGAATPLEQGVGSSSFTSCSARQRLLLERSKRYYEMAAAQGLAEAKRELGHCYWGLTPSWHGTCSTPSRDFDANGGNGEEEDGGRGGFGSNNELPPRSDGGKANSKNLLLVAANLFADASFRGGGNDLQAYRALAYIHATATSEAKAAQLPRLPNNSNGGTDDGDAEGPFGSGGGAAGGGRPEARRLYAECAEVGGYPDGLPCTVEAYGMELAWLMEDAGQAARAMSLWLSPAPEA
jgi:hypothetical protein